VGSKYGGKAQVERSIIVNRAIYALFWCKMNGFSPFMKSSPHFCHLMNRKLIKINALRDS
jgi:hypothetical protein